MLFTSELLILSGQNSQKQINRYLVEKAKCMKVADLQIQLHQAIDTITDAEKLEAIYTLLKGSTGPFEPMSREEYSAAIDEARQQIGEGKHISVDDLEKESESWWKEKKSSGRKRRKSL